MRYVQRRKIETDLKELSKFRRTNLHLARSTLFYTKQRITIDFRVRSIAGCDL